MGYQITPFIISPFLGVICALIFIAYILAYKPTYYYKPLILLCSGVTIWLLANILQLMSTNIDFKILFNRISSVGIIMVTIYFFIFTALYTGKKEWTAWPKLIFLFIIPAAELVLEFTNKYHHLIITNYELINANGNLFLIREYGLFFWVWIIYAYLLLAVSCIMLINLLINSIKFYRKQAIFLLSVLALPIIANLLFFAKITPLSHIDFTPIALTASILIMLLGITRLKLGEIVPIARSALVENMRDGLIVIDTENIILDINPMAKKIMGMSNSGQLLGKKITATWNKAGRYINSGSGKEIKKVTGKGNIKVYEVDISGFKDYSGKLASKVILLRDITERKKIEDSLKERVELSKLISKISTSFISSNIYIDKKINSALGQIGKFAGVDRSYLFLYSEKDRVFKKINSWTRKSSHSKVNESIEGKPWLMDFLKNYEQIYISNLQNAKDLPEKAQSLRHELIQKGIKSLLIAPIYMGENIFGFIGFDSIRELKQWNEEDVSLLKIAGNMFLNAIQTKKARRKINYLSFHDPLTDLYNRAYVEEEFKRLNHKRYLPLSFIILDINGLKLINDTLGFEYGDKLIKKVARILQKTSRRGDIIARWGGDEFAILLPNTKEQDANKIMERISGEVQKTKAHKIKVTLSMGICTKIEPSQKIREIIKESERRLDRQKLTESKSISSSIISSLSQSLWEKSNETEEHAKRMKKLAVKLGQIINLPTNKIDELKLLAPLHDIGKIAVPDGILEKSSKLSKKEWGKIKTHTEVGYRIAKSSKQLSYIANGILCHHERWDGSGYPQGLAGEEIPITSRIIAIVDAFDVMVHGRPYKKAMSVEQAVKELKIFAGIQFDPHLTEKFIKVLTGTHAFK
ncbi:MAG: histidine kinase N-terminal 7TM domain-containing protein [Actinomycetota bacterium]